MLNSMARRLAALETRSSFMTAKFDAFRAKITALNGGTITDVTNANPAEITSSSHGLVTDDIITIEGVTGSTGVNDTLAITKTGTNTFTVPVDAGGAYGGGGTWTGRKYSWTERWFTSAGILEDKFNAREGVPEDGHAYERNNVTITDFPVDVEMRARCSSGGVMVHEFDAPSTAMTSAELCAALNEGATTTVRLVSNVCPTIVDDVVTAIEVEYRNLTLPECLLTVGDVACESDPADCCDDPCEHCDSVCEPLPNQYLLTNAGFINDEEGCVDCDLLNGEFLLTCRDENCGSVGGWCSDEFEMCGCMWHWVLQCGVPTVTWYLSLESADGGDCTSRQIAGNFLDGDTWVCEGPNVFAGGFAGAELGVGCVSTGATSTVTPV